MKLIWAKRWKNLGFYMALWICCILPCPKGDPIIQCLKINKPIQDKGKN